MKVLRIKKGDTRIDRLRNERIIKYNLRWSGHVKRMKESRYPKKLL